MYFNFNNVDLFSYNVFMYLWIARLSLVIGVILPVNKIKIEF